MAIDRSKQSLSLSVQLQIELNKPENSSLLEDAKRSERITTLKREANNPESPWQPPKINPQIKL
jgi:hypothetical protein